MPEKHKKKVKMIAHFHELHDLDLLFLLVMVVPKVVHDQRHWHREQDLQGQSIVAMSCVWR